MDEESLASFSISCINPELETPLLRELFRKKKQNPEQNKPGSTIQITVKKELK